MGGVHVSESHHEKRSPHTWTAMRKGARLVEYSGGARMQEGVVSLGGAIIYHANTWLRE